MKKVDVLIDGVVVALLAGVLGAVVFGVQNETFLYGLLYGITAYTLWIVFRQRMCPLVQLFYDDHEVGYIGPVSGVFILTLPVCVVPWLLLCMFVQKRGGFTTK